MTDDRMKPFREIHASDLESHSLKDAMDSDGYVLIRGLLPAADLQALLSEMTQIISDAGWLLSDHSPLERIAKLDAACGDSDPSFQRIYDQIFGMECFHAFPHHPALRHAMELLVGPRLLVQPKLIARLIFPHCERLVARAHQDHQGIAGDPETFTAWMPLHDCPTELGPLQILEASHRFGVQLPDPATGFLARETLHGGEWVGGAVNAGDVLIFHSLTVHAASLNLSNQLRISIDCRFQDYARAVNPAQLVFVESWEDGKSWERYYAKWNSSEWKHYWKKLPLKFAPSRAELAQLAQTDASARMRERYARVHERIESEMPV